MELKIISLALITLLIIVILIVIAFVIWEIEKLRSYARQNENLSCVECDKYLTFREKLCFSKLITKIEELEDQSLRDQAFQKLDKQIQSLINERKRLKDQKLFCEIKQQLETFSRR